MSTLVEHIEQAYDELPYTSGAFAATAPERLQAIAHLFGLRAPEPAQARVLELGCAAGGNLIPFVARHPGARAVGIDLAKSHVSAGEKAVEAMRLDNIELRRMSIADITPDLGEFDYIICHGVYSWVPEEVSDAILRVCSENLAEDGIALVSYNTYPGWKAKEIVRDAMMLRGSNRASSKDNLAYARGMIDFMYEMAPPDSVLKKVLDENIATVRSNNEHYLAHEFLELCNAPCYFRDFLAAARSHGLDYLAESDTGTMFASNYGRACDPMLRECGGKQDALEQLFDFVSNRTFRQTLLVHAKRARDIDYRLQPERLRQLHIAGTFDELPADSDGQHRFKSLRQATIGATGAEQAALLRAVNDAFPATLSMSDCLAAAPEAEDAQDAIIEFVERLIVTGNIIYRLQPIPGIQVGDRPRALPGLNRLAALKADADLPLSLFNSWHEAVANLNIIEASLLPLLDGQHDRQALIERLLDHAHNDKIVLRSTGSEQLITDPERVRQEITRHVETALQTLQRRGMLASADDGTA